MQPPQKVNTVQHKWKRPDALLLTIAILVSAIMINSVLSFVILTRQNSPPARPMITLTQPTLSGALDNQTSEWRINHTSEPTYPFNSYRVQIFMDGGPLATSAQTLEANAAIRFGPKVWLYAQDLGFGKLGTGGRLDAMELGYPHSWRFSLIWAADGFELASLSWSTP